ncbi:MAG: hypothetical protein ACOH18_05615 [Candidatus Saccharimonadaceae bacterium]
MAFWNDISKFAGNLTGGLIGESDKEREEKERLKQQAAAQARAQATQNATRPATTPSVTNASRPTNATVANTQAPVGINNQAVRATPKYTYRQRADKGYDFYADNQKTDKETYLKNTGEDDNALTLSMANGGDSVSAQRVLDTVQGGMFRQKENVQRSMAQKVVDEAKKNKEVADKTENTSIINSAYDGNLRLQNKSVGVKEYIDDYNNTDAWRQQRIRDELAQEVNVGEDASPAAKAKAQEAALLIASLEEKGAAKFDLAQKGVKLGVDLISGIQRGGTAVLDTALMGGGVLGTIGQSDENIAKTLAATELERQKLKEMKALDGRALNDKKDFAFTGDFGRDAADLTGRSLDVALSSTMFANPTALVGKGAAGAGAKEALGTILRDSTFFGGADAVQGGLSNYGETGDMGQAAKAALESGVTSAVTQGVLGSAGYAGGNLVPRAGKYLANDWRKFAADFKPVNAEELRGRGVSEDEIMRMGYKEKLTEGVVQGAESQLGRQLTAPERLELDNAVKKEVEARTTDENPGGFNELATAPKETDIATSMNPPETDSPTPLQETAENGLDNRAKNNLGLDSLDARERFGKGREDATQNPESQQAIVDQEINARISQLPDDNFVKQMTERFGLTEAAVRRLMQQTNKSDLFRKLNDSADFVRGANSPDAAATSIVNKATDAGRAAAARAGVDIPEFVKPQPVPEAKGQGPLAAPESNGNTTIDDQNRLVDKTTGEILFDPATGLDEIRRQESANGDGLQEITDVNDLSARAKNSLENDTTGQKPGGVVRSGQFVENANAKPVEYRTLEDGSVVIVDGRHTLEYAKQNGITDFPMKDVTADYAPKVDAKSIAEQTAALPDSRKAVGADIPRIKETQTATNEQLNNFEADTTPDSRAKMMKEVAEHERSGAPISSESKAIYDEFVRPVVDALYGKSRRNGTMGRKDYYLPEELAGTDAPVESKYGSTWADEANMEFGHSMRREGKIDSADLADPATSLKNYVQQFYQDNYGHLSPENIAEAEGRGAVDGAAYVTGRRNVAEKLDESMVRSLTDKRAGKSNKTRVKDTLNIAQDIRANADTTLDPDSIIHLKGGVSAARAVQTNRKVANKIEAGDGQTVYERFGMRQFENAEALGNNAFEENFQPGITREEYSNSLHGYYDALYEREFTDVMSPERYHEIIGSGISQSHRLESGAPLARVEQALAMEKAIYASEHIRYSDKATQNYVDYEVGHMLRRGKAPATIGRTVANNISRTFYTGALGLNPLSAIQNFTELSRVAGLTATKDTLKTLEAQVKGASPKEVKATLESYGVDSNRIRQEMTDALPTSKKALKFAGKIRDKVEDTVMVGFNFTETLKNYGMIKALEIKHADIADPRQRREAILDDFNANSLIGGHYGNLVGVDRSNLARVAMQFGTYTMRDWGQIADRAKAGDAGYVARVLGTKAAIALPMYALFGTSLAYTLGINEFKGGPIVSLTTELINSIVEENNRVESEQEEGKKAEFDWGNVTSQFSKKSVPLVVPGGNFMFNKLGVQDAVGFDKDNKIFREDTFIGDMQKGYNKNKNGQPRFAAPDGSDPMSVVRGILGGAYNTDEARSYFGKDFWAKPQLFGLFDTNTQKNSPAYGRFQDKIESQSSVLTDPNATKESKDKARATIRDTFDKAYQSQDLKNEFFESNPNAAGIYKDMTKATFNKETGKRETDVITPEKWKYVESEKSGELFNYLKNRAEQNNKNFGDPIDPIYNADLTEAQRREVLNLRSSYTGDDKERKSMLYEQEWYPKFAEKMSAYYDEMGKQTYAEDSDYGKTKRAQEYMDLSGKMPQKDDLYKQYTALRYGDSKTGKKGDEDAGKAFYKANADKLNAVNEKFQKESFEWTNKMRVLEGTTPLTWESFTNDTYGYKSGGSGNGFTPYAKKESTKTGAEENITNYGGKATGPVKLKLKQNELVDVTKVVKQPARATKKANIRITI